MSRYGVSLMVGTGAGLFLIGYLKSNVIQQVAGLLKPVVEHSAEYGTTWATVGNLILIVGTIAGLSYFFFSKAHKGAFGVMTKVGIYFLMISFGAAFGYRETAGLLYSGEKRPRNTARTDTKRPSFTETGIYPGLQAVYR